jgi:hypothetical protein
VGSPVVAQEVDEAVSAGLAPPAGGQCGGPPPPATVGLAPSCWSARSSARRWGRGRAEGGGKGGGQMAEGDGGSPRRRAALVSSSCGGGDPPPAPGPAARVRADGQAGGSASPPGPAAGFEQRWWLERCRGGRQLGQRQARVREKMGKEKLWPNRYLAKCQICKAHYVQYAPRIFDT